MRSKNYILPYAFLLSFCGTDPELFQDKGPENNNNNNPVQMQQDSGQQIVPSAKECNVENCGEVGWFNPPFETDGPVIRFTTVTGSLEEEIIVNFPAYCGTYAIKFRCTGPEYATLPEHPPLDQCYLINDFPLARVAAEAEAAGQEAPIYYFGGEPGIMILPEECIALENNVQVLLVSFEPPTERYRGTLEFCLINPDVERPYECNENQD
ncbi:hypothetical protein HYX13_02720 [Candidatus Woesearchaeota archaeon]|nr:hypothetical protein [Candidatus Woesearchaeota archaeon]